MSDYNLIIANNLIELRKDKKLTQVELAEILNYSDRAISKWEKGDSMPPIEVLVKLSKFYNVTIDYLINEGDERKLFNKATESIQKRTNKLIITLLAISLVWIIATGGFVYSQILFDQNNWILFIWAFPLSFLIAIIFNGIWGKRIITFYLVSFFVWTLLACFFFQFLEYHLWVLFLLGIPAQIAIILWEKLK